MTLLWIALLPLLGVLVPALTAQRGRTWCSLATGILPATALLLTLLQIPLMEVKRCVLLPPDTRTRPGAAFRLDGLSLLFNYCLGIGLLILVCPFLPASMCLDALRLLDAVYGLDGRHLDLR